MHKVRCGVLPSRRRLQQLASVAFESSRSISVQRGSIPFDGSRRLRFEISEAKDTSKDWGLLWTHGLVSSLRSESEGGWPFQYIPSLADVMPVARYDARGHGTSDSGESGCSWSAMGSDILKLRKAWGRKKIVFGGTSMGCAASLFAALEDPDAAQALILATPPTCYEQRAKFVPTYLENAALARRDGLEAAKEASSKKAQPPIFLETEEGRAVFEKGWKEKFSMGMERYCAALEGSSLSDLPSKDVLRTIEIPTLILAWQSDVQHPVASAKMLANTLPNSELHIARSWAEIQDFSKIMRSFLMRLRNDVP